MLNVVVSNRLPILFRNRDNDYILRFQWLLVPILSQRACRIVALASRVSDKALESLLRAEKFLHNSLNLRINSASKTFTAFQVDIFNDELFMLVCVCHPCLNRFISVYMKYLNLNQQFFSVIQITHMIFVALNLFLTFRQLFLFKQSQTLTSSPF